MVERGEKSILVPETYPAIHPPVFKTDQGTLYLKDSGVVMISGPAVDISGLKPFLEGFPAEYDFAKYLDDPTVLSPTEQLIKVAGQACYASFGEKRTYNDNAQGYIDNIISSGHGSVLEHANFSLLLYGISRSLSHELVRHRAGMAYSQLSQRYVSGRVLRFVEKPEYQNDPKLHRLFEERIDRARAEYEEMSEILLGMQKEGDPLLSAEGVTDRRKKVQQTARSLLPNETETVMIVTGNIRAFRHIISMRVSEHADVEIRRSMFNVFQILKEVTPMLFSDYQVVNLPDGTHAVRTDYPKV